MRKVPFLAIGVAVFLVIAPVSAHHVPAAKFDPAKPVKLTGVVTQIDWLNPHVHIFVNAQNTNPPENWAVELESTVDLRRSGWTRDTVKIGDAVTVQGTAARDGSATAWGDSVIVNSTGQESVHRHSSAAATRPGWSHATLARRTTETGSTTRPDHGVLGIPERDHARPGRRRRFKPTPTASCATSRISTEWRRFRGGPETCTNYDSGIS